MCKKGKNGDKMQNLHKLIIGLVFFGLTFSLFAQTWSLRTPMPTPRSGMAAVELNGKIYVMGGRSSGGPHGGHSLDVVEVYDPQNDQWETSMPNLNFGREQASAISWNGAIYIFGGLDDGNIVQEIEKYVPGSNNWQIIGNMPNARHSMATVVYDSLFWFIGGITSFNNYHQAVSIYNPGNGQWNVKNPLNYARGGGMAFVLRDTLYAAGGFFFGPIRSVEWYDQATQNWQLAGDMPLHCATAGYDAFGNRAWITGGTGQGGVLNQTQILVKNGIYNGWQFGPALNFPRRELVAVAVNNQLYAIGGRGTMGHAVTDVVEMLDLLTGLDTGIQGNAIYRFEMTNYPNPFNPQTILRVSLPKNDEGELIVFDVSGRMVTKLFGGILEMGEWEFPINMEGYASGVYWAVWNGKNFQTSRKLIFMK
ncbi:MAG: hypothetical protein Kow0037_01940 [Calditrichia bacterium]